MLRAWTERDVGALVAAWADPAIQQWTRVPQSRGPQDAQRWIGAEQLRRARGLAIDLVICPEGDPGTVVGEVGMVPLAGGPSRAELGWWVAPQHRRQGLATRAVRLFAGWLRDELGYHDLFAEVDVRNAPSVWVAESAGLRLRLRQDP